MLLLACLSEPPRPEPWDPVARQSAIDKGKEVLTRHECNRCHTVEIGRAHV